MKGINLRKLRKTAGLTQYAVHRETGIGRTKISLAECGQPVLNEREFKAILRVLHRQMRRRNEQIRQALSPADAQEAEA